MAEVTGRKAFARAGFAVLVAIFLGLRIFDLTADPPADLDGSGGIYFDEGMLVQGARNKLLFGSFFQDDWNDLYISPLLSLLKLAVLSVTGVGLLQVRLIPVAFGLGSLLLFYLLLRRGADRETALLGVVLLGCNHIYGMFNRIGLTETPVSFFMLLAGWIWQEAFLRLGASRRAPWLFFGAGAVAFAAYTVKAFPYFIPAIALASVLAWWLPPTSGRPPRRPGALRAALVAAGAFAAGVALPLALWYFAFYRRFAAPIEQASAFYRSQQIPRSAGALLKDLVTSPFFRYFTETPVLLFFSVLFIGLGIYLWFHRRELLLPLDLFFACWFVAHFAMFAILQYRPVRYYLPLVPAMVALAARAMVLLGRRTGLWLPQRLAPPAFALLLPWLAVSLYYGLPQLLAFAAPRLGHATPRLSPGWLAVGAATGSLAALALAAVLARRFGGRTFPLPPRAAALACIVLPAALSLSIDALNWGQWAATRRHVIRDTSRELGAAIPDAYIAGLGAPTIVLENRNRAIHAYGTFFNGNDTFARFPITHLFVGGRNREVEFWYRSYPEEMKRARFLRAVAVKKDHYYLYSVSDPTVEAVSGVVAKGGSAPAAPAATVTVRNNDPARVRDVGAALLLQPVDGGNDIVLPAAAAKAVAPGQRANLVVPGPIPPGFWRLLAFVPPPLESAFEAEYLAHRTGRTVREQGAANDEVWEAAAPGVAITGPNLRYPPGLLRVAFLLRVDHPAVGPVAIFRVTADGSVVLAERRVDAAELQSATGFASVALPPVTLEQERVLEFTAETLGGAKLSFDQVRVSHTPGVWWPGTVLVGGASAD